MITTKHDLCANTAKLNLKELIRVAQIAVARCRWDCEQAINDLQDKQLISNPDKWRQTYGVANTADSLASAASDLAQATNTLHYLLNAEDREIIEINRK